MNVDVDAGRYRAAARETARWLEGVAVVDGDGFRWPNQPTVSDQTTPSLGWGGLGPILFFADAYRTLGDDRHLELAEAGARWLRSLLAARDEQLARQPGLFTGLGGFGIVLDELHRANGDEALRSDLAATFGLIVELSTATPEGAHWAETTEILWGTAGLGCLLLTTGQRWMGDDAVTLATQSGDWLLSQAVPVGDGLRWTLGEGALRRLPASAREVWFPNFAHGTAGIAFFLARLAKTTGETRFLEAAQAAARWILSVCKVDDQTCAAQHHAPGKADYSVSMGPARNNDEQPLYTLGWCHGPPGLAWFFRELQVATGDDEWAEWVSRAANAVRQSGIPERREPGFWDNLGRCCGSAGVVEFFLDLHSWRGHDDDLAFALLVADDMVDRAIVDDDGMRWSNVEFRNAPPDLPPETTFLQGASGIGCTLLRLARHLEGDRSVIRWPHAPEWI